MFPMRQRSSGEIETIYAVHKSGPRNDQTKFLVHRDSGWEWVWAIAYEPVSPFLVHEHQPLLAA